MRAFSPGSKAPPSTSCPGPAHPCPCENLSTKGICSVQANTSKRVGQRERRTSHKTSWSKISTRNLNTWLFRYKSTNLLLTVKGTLLRQVKSLYGTRSTFSVSPLAFSLQELKKKRNHKKQVRRLSLNHFALLQSLWRKSHGLNFCVL